jgi:hypothetical protein
MLQSIRGVCFQNDNPETTGNALSGFVELEARVVIDCAAGAAFYGSSINAILHTTSRRLTGEYVGNSLTLPDWDYHPNDEMESPFEYKAANWGWLDGRPVAIDYSNMSNISMWSGIIRGRATFCCSLGIRIFLARGRFNVARDWVGSCVITINRPRE